MLGKSQWAGLRPSQASPEKQHLTPWLAKLPLRWHRHARRHHLPGTLRGVWVTVRKPVPKTSWVQIIAHPGTRSIARARHLIPAPG